MGEVGKPWDVMVFVIDGTSELGVILNLVEVYPDIRQISYFHRK